MISNSLERNKKYILVLFKEKKFKKVIKYGKKLLKKIPDDTYLLNILGVSSIKLEDYQDAEKYFKKLLFFKQSAELYYNYGNIQKKIKNYKEAINSFNKAIKLNPNFSEAYNNLGNVNKLIDENDEAIKNYKKAIKNKKDNLEAYFNLANVLKENKQYKETKNIYEKILKINDNNIDAQNNLGAIYSILGNFSIAREYFKKVINKNNLFLESYKNYIDITKIDDSDEIFKKLKNMSVYNLSQKNKIDMFYSLSKGYLDQNKNEIGFEYLGKAKKLKKKLSNYSINFHKKLFTNIKNYFDIHHFNKIEHEIDIKNKPIFIVGMPRSGTTLIEQILSSHSDIYGAGELNYLPKIMEEINIKNDNNFEKIIKYIRFKYLKKLTKLSEKPFIIDKLPMNFRWIGFIINAFPEAKIIHLERNPMAVCWSNYKINFNDTGMNFTLSQKDTAEYYVLYDDLIKYWLEKYNKKIINVNYEKFVSNHEKGIEKIIKETDLEWQDNLKTYEKIQRPIETASLHQVREKIFKNSSQKWKKYEDYLKPMQDVLKANNINF
tara:strand:- start:5333 stop:6976 length:1644 start_codon:yes stop_codon:yes gene_type:complete